MLVNSHEPWIMLIIKLMDYDTLWSKKTWLWKTAHLQMIFPAINLTVKGIFQFAMLNDQMVIIMDMIDMIMDKFDWFQGTTLSRSW